MSGERYVLRDAHTAENATLEVVKPKREPFEQYIFTQISAPPCSVLGSLRLNKCICALGETSFVLMYHSCTARAYNLCCDLAKQHADVFPKYKEALLLLVYTR